VAKLVGVKPYVLRYWETEFSIVRPGKTRSKHRLYRRKDVETLLEIRRLLYADRFTIEGAKRRLREGRSTGEAAARAAESATLAEVRQELLELHRMLAPDATPLPTLALGDRRR
jgi:DNA-binding transcriptional MerR regulator